MALRVLAIDPGSKLGWATNQTGRLEWGTEDFRIRNGESSGNRWRRFGEWLNGCTLYERVWPCIDLLVYERAIFMPKARAAAEIAGGFTSRLEEHCEAHRIALQPVAVQTLKAFAIPAVKRKKGDPKMDRSKGAMIRAAVTRLGVTPTVRMGLNGRAHWTDEPCNSGPPIFSEHEADALWLYWYAQHHFNGTDATTKGVS